MTKYCEYCKKNPLKGNQERWCSKNCNSNYWAKQSRLNKKNRVSQIQTAHTFETGSLEWAIFTSVFWTLEILFVLSIVFSLWGVAIYAFLGIGALVLGYKGESK